ncbi:MAG: hypothetical protein O3A51_13555 [Verrucomicrobia bacterium]|nr:hypothetical protein [Verrucomicrobiota bacterium]
MTPSIVPIHNLVGQLPPFWDRSVIFFANLLSLFYGNAGGTRTLRDAVGRIDSYGGRLAPIINLLFKGGNNLLVLQREPDAALVNYFVKDLGLSLPSLTVLPYEDYDRFADVIAEDTHDWPKPYRVIADHSAEWVDGFVTDEHVAEIAQSLGKTTLSGLTGSRRGNNKVLLHRFLLEQGIPAFDTEFAETRAELGACITALQRRGYARVVVKAQVGASGIGMIKLPANPESAGDVPDYLFYEGSCLVQGWLTEDRSIRAIHSPSVQLFVHHDGIYLYDITEQILSDDSVHQGNHAPPGYLRRNPAIREQLLEQAGRVGRWLYDQEYRGTASIDFLVTETTDSMNAIVCEINARVTGATYPAVLARRFVPGGSWIMRNLLLTTPMEGARILAEIDDEKCLYRPGDRHGVIPINFNFTDNDRVDKGQFLCVAEDADGCMEMMDEIEDALPIDWSHDRD